MKIFESDMSEEDAQKVSDAYSKKANSSLFGVIFHLLILIFFNFQFKELGYYKYLILLLPVISTIYQLKKAINIFFFNPIRKDLELQKKIAITLIISKKTEGYKDFELPNGSDCIEFEENPYFASLDVSENSFYNTKIGDEVNFELSKYGKWIIAVYSKSKNIDYNTYKQRKSK
ncbi:hypothetical protein [Cellulophaga sp. HaHa_2_1]|uniref:hypothetical protein n=1 Tax=Cellulophaga sp. HaHa_2_1 TaxID=2749994 RepID=UPI001C4F3A45|nr:hypothetical protein [Cellulophaga sp. HaHa_2_1]QXP52853.1 hypothetical protein H0I24_02700 [Cellulophaga sp. HaHa_2_1]